MKKGFFTISIVAIVILVLNCYCYAVSPTIATTLNQKETNDEEVQVEVSISEMENIDEGVNAYSGILKFNSEQLTLVGIEGQDSWNTPTYNEDNAEKGGTKVIATSNQFTKETGPIFVATFEKKSAGNIDKVQFEDFEVAAKVNGVTSKITEKSEIQPTQDVSIKDKTLNSWVILGILVALVLLIFGLLFIGFGNYRKNKGGEE